MHLSLQCRHLAASHIAHSRSARSRLVTMAGKASRLMVGGHVVEGISIAGQASFSKHPPNCMAGHIIRPVTHKLMQATAWLNLDTQQPVWECQHTLHSNLRHLETLLLCLQENFIVLPQQTLWDAYRMHLMPLDSGASAFKHAQVGLLHAGAGDHSAG